jgi:hypothetical protein
MYSIPTRRKQKVNKIKTLATAALLIVSAAEPVRAQDPASPEVEAGAALGVFSKLVGGTWAVERTRDSGEEVRVEIRYSEGASPLSVYIDVKIWVDGALWEDMHGIISQHPHTGNILVQMVNSFASLQIGEEIESSDSHVVINGSAYSPDGSADHWVWTVRCDNPEEYIDQVMVFSDGAWQENPPSAFRRVR